MVITIKSKDMNGTGVLRCRHAKFCTWNVTGWIMCCFNNGRYASNKYFLPKTAEMWKIWDLERHFQKDDARSNILHIVYYFLQVTVERQFLSALPVCWTTAWHLFELERRIAFSTTISQGIRLSQRWSLNSQNGTDGYMCPNILWRKQTNQVIQ